MFFFLLLRDFLSRDKIRTSGLTVPCIKGCDCRPERRIKSRLRSGYQAALPDLLNWVRSWLLLWLLLVIVPVGNHTLPIPISSLPNEERAQVCFWPPLYPQPSYSVWHRESEVAQSCPTLCDPKDCSLPGFSVHGICQARVLEWVAISFSRGSSQPRD